MRGVDGLPEEDTLGTRIELEHDGEMVVLAVSDAILGRTGTCEIQLVHPLVSRRQCRIEATPSGVFVEDLGSSNGTYLNGRPLDAQRRMQAGDLLRIGSDGPTLRLVRATVDGADVAGADAEALEETMIAGDPRAAGRHARLAVSPQAAAAAESDEEPETRATGAPISDPTGEGSIIPVAVPLDAAGDSRALRSTDIFEPRGRRVEDEPPTRPVAARAATRPEAPTRPAAPRHPIAEPPTVRVDDAAAPQAPRAIDMPAQPPKTPPTGATATARGVLPGLVFGAVLGLLVVLLAAIFTDLSTWLHDAAPALRLIETGGEPR